MELYIEKEKKKDSKKKIPKAPIIIGVIIFLLIVMMICIIVMITNLESSVLEISVDGVSKSDLTQLVLVKQQDDGTSKLYYPVRKVASYFGYADYAGDFKNKSEDTGKCYVDNGDEIAMFTINSDALIISRDDSDYEEVSLDEMVFEQDGQLYTTAMGLKTAFNLSYDDKDPNKIKIYTLDYLATYYTKRLNIEKTSKEFRDKKAILVGNMIVQASDTKKYGVMDITTGQYVLEAKYDSISYLPYSQNYLVENSGKYGVMSRDSKTIIKIAYDDIEVMDNQKGLYIVKEDSLYGVIDNNGNVILRSLFQQIGVGKLSTYEKNGIESPYILLDSLIPVKYNNYWGFFNIKGEQVTNVQFTGVGCTISKLTNTYPVVVIPSLEMIIVKENNYYTFINKNGQKVINGTLDTVYLTTDASTGKNTYYMTYGGITDDIEAKFASLGY